MTVLKPRTRLVNFRLTEDEFQNLKLACSLNGARSMSDFARSAVLRTVVANGHQQQDPFPDRLSTLDLKLSELVSSLRYLIRVLEKPLRRGS